MKRLVGMIKNIYRRPTFAYGQFQINGGLNKKDFSKSWRLISNQTIQIISMMSGNIFKKYL